MTSDESREQFEAWITAPPYERDVSRWSNDPTKHSWPGNYEEYAVQLAWEAWQAARETPSKGPTHEP